MEPINKKNINNKIIKIAQVIFQRKKISIKSTANSLSEWDSLNHLKLMIHLQKNFKIKFELNEIININSLEKWSKLIKKKLNKK